jgi:hypothetical protein
MIAIKSDFSALMVTAAEKYSPLLNSSVNEWDIQ